MPRSKKSTKQQSAVSESRAKKSSAEAELKGDNQWVHVDKAEEPQHDSWEIVENVEGDVPSSTKDDVQDENLSDDDLVEILEDNVAVKSRPKAKALCTEVVRDKRCYFQIIGSSSNESSSSSENILTEMVDTVSEDTVKHDSKTAQVLPSDNMQSQNEKISDSNRSETHEPAAPIDMDDLKDKSIIPSMWKVMEEQDTDSATGKSDNSATEEEQQEAASFVTASVMPDDSSDGTEAADKIAKANTSLTKANEEQDDTSKSNGKSKGRNKNRKNKSKDQSEASVPKATTKKDTCVNVTERRDEDKFVTYAKSREARDLTTLSVLLAHDETVENVFGKADEKQEANIPPLHHSAATDNLETEEVEGELLAETVGVQIDDNSENTDSSKLSKSAKRRRKQKAKMAKAIESISKPAVLLDKYEKTFGEDYEPSISSNKEVKIDSSLTCAVCLDLYHRPHIVQPCQHIFCEPCLKKQTTKSNIDVPCPICRNQIQSCSLDEELCYHINQSYPVKVVARNRAERKSKSKKNPLPKLEKQPLSRELISQLISTTNRTRSNTPRFQLPINRSYIQKLTLVLISVISYIFTSLTIRAIAYLLINDSSVSNILMLLLFCVYFYIIDRGFKKLKTVLDS